MNLVKRWFGGLTTQKLKPSARRSSVSNEQRHSHVDANACVGGFMGRLGLNPALARRTTTRIGDLWVVPCDGWLALWDGSATANRTEVIVRQGAMMWTSSQDGHGIIYGLVPDGVSDVTLVDSNETSLFVPIADSVYGARLNGHFRSLSFIGLTGSVKLGPFF